MTLSHSESRNSYSVRAIASISIVAASVLSVCVAAICQASGDSAELHAAKGLALAKAKEFSGAEQELRLAVNLSPGRAQFQAQLGSILGLEGKLDESEECFEKAVSFEPANANYRMDLSAVEWQIGRPVDAETNLNAILRNHPTDHEATLLLGMVEDSRGNCRKATTLLNAETGLVSERPEFALAALHSYYACGETEHAKATAAILAQNSANPAWQGSIYKGCHFATDAGDFTTARSLLGALSSTHSDSAQYNFELAALAYRSGEFSDCNSRLAEQEKQTVPTGKLEGLAGRCALASKQYEVAEEHFERAVKLDPEDLSNYNVLIEIELQENHLDSAMKFASQAAIRFPQHLDVWMWKGSAELDSGHYHEAVASYTHAMSIHTANSEALLGLANAQLLSGDPFEAYKTYEQGIRQFPVDARFLLGFANALMQSPESARRDVADRVQASLKKAIQLDGNSPAAHYLLGQSFLDEGRLAHSLDELLTAETKDPDNASIHFALERVLRRLGRTDEARKEFLLFQQTKDTRATDPLYVQPNPAEH